MARPLLSLLFFLSLTGAIPTDRCLNLNKRCDMHDNLISSTFGFTGPECYELCRNLSNCSAYSYFGAGSFPFGDQCMLFSNCDVLDDCDDCITASVRLDCSCGIGYEGFINYENLVRYEVDVLTEPECRRHCSNDISCNVYTYYNDDHDTDKHLCILLREMKSPITPCENCQTAPQKCVAFDECIVGFYEDEEGNEISSKGLLVSESTSIRYVSGENGCFKTVNGLAVGSGGSGGYTSSGLGYGAGGGSGHINTTQLSVPANTNIAVDIDMSGSSTALTMQNTGEILLSAANGESVSSWNIAGDGYSGGGGCGSGSNSDGGDGGTDGGDGEKGPYDGGNGSGFDISSVDMNYFQLEAGKGGQHSGKYGGGGGGVLVDAVGPEVDDRVGEGFGGGGPGDSSDRSGSPGCVILEL